MKNAIQYANDQGFENGNNLTIREATYNDLHVIIRDAYIAGQNTNNRHGADCQECKGDGVVEKNETLEYCPKCKGTTKAAQ
jgi:DnaJ-class molecular chaperone